MKHSAYALLRINVRNPLRPVICGVEFTSEENITLEGTYHTVCILKAKGKDYEDALHNLVIQIDSYKFNSWIVPLLDRWAKRDFYKYVRIKS